ncbi:MAG: hypothetical protein JRN20_12650 [Nitrososphaerota archaeon]|jgi:hypothetical protein|nr:hypothetical protein [Nitrososphaerota archaeon]
MVSENDMGMTGGSTEEETPMSAEMPEVEQPVAPVPAKSKSKSGGRRAALRILRENVDSLGKDVASFRKAQEASSKKLEKQIAALRSDISALKSHIAKDGAHARAKREQLLTKILAKVNASKPKAAPKKKAKKSKGKK